MIILNRLENIERKYRTYDKNVKEWVKENKDAVGFVVVSMGDIGTTNSFGVHYVVKDGCFVSTTFADLIGNGEEVKSFLGDDYKIVDDYV